MNGFIGFCGENHLLKIAHIGTHFGEEPPITGNRGSGTIFFTGCSLKCSFCQNYQISRNGLGKVVSLEEYFASVIYMIDHDHVQNINFVTPDHFFPYTFLLVKHLRDKNYPIPVVYNLSGYQSLNMLRIAEDYSDIYLPDFKYSDPHVSNNLSGCKDYPDIALQAIMEMIRQKGFLDSFQDPERPAKKGVLVRHLILPGMIMNSINALTMLFLEFGPELPLSLMSQYQPIFQLDDTAMNRPLLKEEFDKVYSHALELGFENMFVQFPEETPSNQTESLLFLPDFRKKEPFLGNRS